MVLQAAPQAAASSTVLRTATVERETSHSRWCGPLREVAPYLRVHDLTCEQSNATAATAREAPLATLDAAAFCLASVYRWLAIAGDSHLRMAFMALATQLLGGGEIPGRELLFGNASLLSSLENSPDNAAAICCSEECSANVPTCQRRCALFGSDALHRGLGRFVASALRGAARWEFCVTYSDMRFPRDTHELLRPPDGDAKEVPDALVLDPAIWPVWKGWLSRNATTPYAAALTALLRRAVATNVASGKPRAVVLWSSPPTLRVEATGRKPSKFDFGQRAVASARDIALAAIERVAEEEHRRGEGCMPSQRRRGTSRSMRMAFVDALRIGIDGIATGRMPLFRGASHDGVHWPGGAPPRDWFRATAGLEPSLSSCSTELTIAALGCAQAPMGQARRSPPSTSVRQGSFSSATTGRKYVVVF